MRAAYSIETSDAERVGVDQVAKILPGGGKAGGSEQRESLCFVVFCFLFSVLRCLRCCLLKDVALTSPANHTASP